MKGLLTGLSRHCRRFTSGRLRSGDKEIVFQRGSVDLPKAMPDSVSIVSSGAEDRSELPRETRIAENLLGMPRRNCVCHRRQIFVSSEPPVGTDIIGINRNFNGAVSRI